VRYEEFLPEPALRHYIADFWRFSTDSPGEHIVVPDGTLSIVWARNTAILVGPRITALRVSVTPGWEYWGIRFLPGIAGVLLAIDIPRTRDVVLPLHSLAPAPAAQFVDAMQVEPRLTALTSLAHQWIHDAPPPDTHVQELVRRIIASNGASGIAQLCLGLGVSYRQILRRFQCHTGMSPKELARLRRIRWACLQALRSGGAWAGISAESGFADQSHLTREFSGVFGWPPELVKEYLQRIDHHIAGN